MLKVFLSGGMSGLTYDEMNHWRIEVKKAFGYYCNVKVISPTSYFEVTDDDDNEKEAFLFDVYQTKSADVIVVNLDKLDSIGTAQEIALAYEYRKPIIAIAHREKWENAHSWYKQEVTKVFIYEDYDDIDDIYKDVVSYVMMYQ